MCDDSKKMSKEFPKTGNIEIDKQKFHFCKSSVTINVINIGKILISYEFIYDKNENNWTKKNFEYFMGLKDGKIIKPFCILAPKMSKYINCFKESKYIYFLIKIDNS